MTNYALKVKDIEPTCTLCGTPIFNFCRHTQKYHPSCAKQWRTVIKPINDKLFRRALNGSIKYNL